MARKLMPFVLRRRTRNTSVLVKNIPRRAVGSNEHRRSRLRCERARRRCNSRSEMEAACSAAMSSSSER
eukprot:58538-Pyramimonas_sp.AAC.1